MRRISITIALFVWVFLSPLHAAEVVEVKSAPLADELFVQSIKRLSELPGFQCQFDQLMRFSDGGSQQYSGEVAMLKPKRFRWSYTLPYEQLYVGDGSVIWHYEPDLMQAERLNDLDQVDPAVMKLLDGRVSLKDLDVLDSDKKSKSGINRYQVRIGDSPEVWLGFDNKGDLVSVERIDMLGNSNQMTLSGCSYVAPSTNLFSFTPPEGVDRIDLRSANSE
ncbi:outer membrane lipoprotein carrier protein [Mariprofundus ferrinatatus]|uniref:Outer membrane lipoprotein carrier protein n=1 Tax=Mariprofundus ferrinatatus TaxID=1921087 RepID=A0A2K8L4J4_9PROT|nr:outer-membrane lipoprotein carrier protein LolA [Mariprofundus ferrinatatus]ATX82163.1 outer membrane lipoprotein carrier protein [Mariprofundus ferrinatatus]